MGEKKVVKRFAPSISSFSIINSDWLRENGNEDTEELIKQVVCYITLGDKKGGDRGTAENCHHTFDSWIDDHEIVKQIGLINAIADISSKFNSNSETGSMIESLETDKSRTVIGYFEANVWYYAEFNFASVELDDGSVVCIPNGLAHPSYLKKVFNRGYKLWLLNNGLMDDGQHKDRNNLRHLAQSWWSVWLKNKFEFDSSFGLTNDAMFSSIDGLRYSSVLKPPGFNENIHNAIKEFLATEKDNGLLSLCVLNTNLNPIRNWGILYVGEDSLLDWSNLIDIFKDLDFSLGLSTYSLTVSNWPSLKEYLGQLRRLHSIKPNGGLFERSLMIPYELHNQLKSNVFNPFTDFVPDLKNVQKLTSYIPSIPAMESLTHATLHPWSSFSSYWNVPSTSDEIETEEVSAQMASGTSLDANLSPQTKNSQESNTHVTGSYLLGLTQQGSVITHDYYLETVKKNHFEKFTILVYEINGILFVLGYEKGVDSTKNPDYYPRLSAKLNNLYEVHFTDLISNQLKDASVIRELCCKRPELHADESLHLLQYIVYNAGKYWTNMENIPPDYDMIQYQLPSRGKKYEDSNIGVDRMFALMQDRKLQSIINGNLVPSSNWIIGEKIVKLDKSQWCLFRRFADNNWALVVIAEQKHAFGDYVKEWFAAVRNGAYK